MGWTILHNAGAELLQDDNSINQRALDEQTDLLSAGWTQLKI
jgi:hypothetical protein